MKKLIIILALCLVLLILCICGIKFFKKDKDTTATATVSISVLNSEGMPSDINVNLQTDITTQCIYFLKMPTNLRNVRYQLDFPITEEELENVIEAKMNEENSSVIEITVSAQTKEQSDKILSALISKTEPLITTSYPNVKIAVEYK